MKWYRRLLERVLQRLARFSTRQWVALIAALAAAWLLMLLAVFSLSRGLPPSISQRPTPPPFQRSDTPTTTGSPAASATSVLPGFPTPTFTLTPSATTPAPSPTSGPTATPTPRGPQAFFAAPGAQPGGDGSEQQPFELAAALQDTANIHPGDTLWLKGGLYGDGGSTQYLSTLAGAEGQPVIVRAAPGERATINGGISIQGGWVTFWGLEITNSDSNRLTAQNGSNPTDITRRVGFDVLAPNVALINNIVHDAKNGIGVWSKAVDALVYGNIVYNNGFDGSDRTHGHGIYAQNDQGTKHIEDNVVFNNFSTYNVHVYTEEGSIQGFVFAGNAIFNGQFLVGGLQPAGRITIQDNHLYAARARFGYKNEHNLDLTLTGNYLGGDGDSALEIKWWQTLDVHDNTIWNERAPAVSFTPPDQPGQAAWDHNSYYAAARSAFQISERNANWKQWQERSSFDADSSFVQGLPQGQAVFVRPNRFEAGRANLILYNWDKRDSVAVDLSQAGLQPGDRYVIHNAQNYFDETLTGTYAGGTVDISMRGWSSALPVGMGKSLYRSTFPVFGVFVVEKAP